MELFWKQSYYTNCIPLKTLNFKFYLLRKFRCQSPVTNSWVQRKAKQVPHNSGLLTIMQSLSSSYLNVVASPSSEPLKLGYERLILGYKTWSHFLSLKALSFIYFWLMSQQFEMVLTIYMCTKTYRPIVKRRLAFLGRHNLFGN